MALLVGVKMPEIQQCAICFKNIDRATEDFAIWQVQWQQHPQILVHASCAETKKVRPIAYDFDRA